VNMCRVHSEPSRDQRQGAKSGDCFRCPKPERKRPHSKSREKEEEQPTLYVT